DFGYTRKVVNTNLTPITIYELQNLEAIRVDRVSFNNYLKEPTLMVSDSQPTNISNVNVSKGDMIFFRVNNSQVPIEDSQVTWNPEIAYTTDNFDSPNGYKQYSSKYSDSFIYGNSFVEPILIKENGAYTISWDNFTINNLSTISELSDDVIIKVYLYRHEEESIEMAPGIDNTSPLVLTQVIKRNTNNVINNPNFTFYFNDINRSEPLT